ncbi:MAG: amidotransferase 1, exosortase A system-associated [Magnetococcales bacterium]|nr:amidotransferase 1, exosortase A system-associated [Magnetococcales bacterium]
MCGIVGVFDCREERPVAPNLVTRMNDAQAHRGPDGAGVRVLPGLGFGHRRLAIIDLEGGVQPMENEDGSVLLVFNGEIYNFHELYQELVALGHRFRTRSDTEVIVHAWESWGRDCLLRLRGMFAFALWDQNAKTLFLARDRLGMKPLYYTFHPEGWLIFASELAGLTAWRPGSWSISPRAVECFFALGYIPDPEAIFSGIHKLEPGYSLLARRGGAQPRPERYWDVRFSPGPPLTRADAAAELLERLEESVRAHMVADVPVASFLSGGIDSSAVSLLMARASDQPLEACTISFGDPLLDESAHAAKVAERHGLRHHIERADPQRFDLLDTLARHYGEPFADPSALPTWLVCGLARQHAKVVLSGDGGDESLAGYRRYRLFLAEERVRALLPYALRRPLFGLLGRCYPKLDRAPPWLRARCTFQSLARDWVDGAFQGVAILRDDLREQLFTPAFARQLQGFRAGEIFRAYARDAPEHPLSRLQYLDFKGFLAGQVLVKVDRASMAHGLEVRAPLLDYRLVEWMAGLPPEFKLHRGEGKAILKEGLRPLLPEDLARRPKQGFVVPLAAWLRGPLARIVQERIPGTLLTATGWFDRPFLARMVAQHLSGTRDFAYPLWALLIFESFMRQMEVAKEGAIG